MAKLKIEGQRMLSGEIKISGAKNSAVALLPAAVLAKTKSIIYNVPEISDIKYLIDIMKLLNCDVKHENETLYIDSSKFVSMGKATPFEGNNVYGRCKMTICGGREVFNDLG